MTNTTPVKTCRWGLLATGEIAKSFALDVLVDPTTRGIHDFNHTVTAVASSSGLGRAQQFLKDINAPSDAKAYGSYEEFVKDDNVDVVYVATPHSHHYQNVRLCLEAGRSVLCEKAFTVNAPQLKILIDIAREKKLFLMEAMWTRYFPLSRYLDETVKSGKLGIVNRAYGDLTMPLPLSTLTSTTLDRKENPLTAGGALLELGVYPINWCFQGLYSPHPSSSRQPPTVQATVQKHHTGVDAHTTILLTFPRPTSEGGDAHAVATCSFTAGEMWRLNDHPFPQPTQRIVGTKGELEIFHPAFRPMRTKLVAEDGKVVEERQWPHPGPGRGSGWYNRYGFEGTAEGEARGMYWQADEAARGVFEGRGESTLQGLDESLLIMQVMDEVRRQGGVRYPDKLETTEYPVKI